MTDVKISSNIQEEFSFDAVPNDDSEYQTSLRTKFSFEKNTIKEPPGTKCKKLVKVPPLDTNKVSI